MAQDFTATPLLETAVRRFVVRIALRQHVPLRPRVQNPQDGFEHIARRNRFASRTAFRNMFFRKMFPDAFLVFIAQTYHTSDYTLCMSIAPRPSVCATGHPSPSCAFGLAASVAFGGPRSSCVRHGAHYAPRHGSHNDFTPDRFALCFVSTRATAQTPTKHPALRLRGGRRTSLRVHVLLRCQWPSTQTSRCSAIPVARMPSLVTRAPATTPMQQNSQTRARGPFSMSTCAEALS